MIIATVNQKGGVGKSTIAVHLVAWLREQGIETALVDADVQGSSSEWTKEIETNTPVYRFQSADEILDEVKLLEEKMIVIDGPAGLGEVTRATLLVSDVALIPCGPSVLDVRAASDAVKALDQVHAIRGDLPKGVFVPNKLQKNYRLSDELLVTAKTLGLEIAPGLGLRQAFADSAGQRSAVWRMGHQAKPAANEALALFEYLFPNEMEQ
ncbi:MAG: ParA family protein [Akkermansiaceae bacterium]|nr:ParA family protein [Akkermansiaceae bacterium]